MINKTLGKIQTGTLGKEKSIYNDMFDKKIIAEFYRGSIAHNMYVEDKNNIFPSDDQDIMVIYYYPIQYYFTLESYNKIKEVFEEKEGNQDTVGYEIKKMFHLLSGLNPNTTPALYTRDQDFTLMHPAWKYVREHRDIFVKKTLIRDVYFGYAQAQYRRMIDKSSWFGYMGEKRKKLYEKVGYDSKYAAHSIRLMRMGQEFLRDGEPVVFREKDRDELLEIKEGKWSLEKIQNLYSQEMLGLEKEFRISKLPDKDTKHNVNKLLFDVMEILYEN
jgi:hypothetical protein